MTIDNIPSFRSFLRKSRVQNKTTLTELKIQVQEQKGC